MPRFIANSDPDTWFDEGTEAFLITDFWWCTCVDDDTGESHCCRSGLFRGIRNGQVDEECCGFCEFEIIEDE